ncbi:ABC transporter permease [Alkalilimnicola sp. S0819]|uniref:ABC transporter permease n=1 Tax=Alkalilimnicola sp. S0819 TaxID=2613922 RepID=UPI001261C13D|nr:FtsX-like permease family protein [Alkalilimnicola sp. S0819]KAB7627662.1 FtsX-like permease family protein [Alkalilimnicola sp. S0819]MPQ15829.1 FtsX-like permease family protein [Alkalilimnicola sp. S0819]
MVPLRFALRQLLRDWRSGELRLLVLAVVLAVTAVSAVGWLAQRVGDATEVRASELLAADRVLETDDPLPDAWLEEAQARGLNTARMMIFPSAVLSGEQFQLASIKAVEDAYPLRGELQVGDSPTRDPVTSREIPPPGEAWVSPRLLLQMDLAVGDTLRLGESELRIGKVLFLEPDRGGGFVNLAPRVLIHFDQVADTGLIQQASRVRYRLLLGGAEAALADYQQWVLAQGRRDVEIETPAEGQPGVGEVMRTAQRFLGLSALLTIIVGGVAMLLTIRRYAARQLDPVAVMRCLGASQRQIVLLFALKLIVLGLLAGALGSLLGFALHGVLMTLVADLLPHMPAPDWRPAVMGLLTGQVVLLGFAVPSVLRLRRVPPLRVLRRDLGGRLLGGLSVYLAALLSVFLLMWWQVNDLQLALYVFGAVLGTLLLLGLGAALTVWLVRVARRHTRGTAALALAGVARRPWTTVIQVVVLGLGLMALLLLGVVRDDLLVAWKARIPPDAPNYFLINVQPEEVAAVQELIGRSGAESTLYPMIRGRLLAISGRPVSRADYDTPRGKRLVDREFNLSWLEVLPADNELAAGQWWDERNGERAQWSVETDIAETLGMELGDELSFEVAGEIVTGRVTSLREVDWDSFNVNFFVVGTPQLLRGLPATYITSFYLPEAARGMLPELVRRYPSVTIIDVNAILHTVRGIIDQGSRVVETMVLLTLAAGLLVLLAALQITREERQFESALLRSLGARRSLIRRLAWVEFALVGGIAGSLAGLGAAAAGWAMADALFRLDYGFPAYLIALGGGAGALMVLLAGALATRRLYTASPMRLLQAAEEN